MTNTHRALIAAAVMTCLVIAEGNVALFASDEAHAAARTISSQQQLDAAIAAANLTSNAQVYRGRPYRMSRNGSMAAMMIGAAAAITGAALLIYANRPECSANSSLPGCGYGMKVIGGSVLTGGAVGLVVGAVTWR